MIVLICIYILLRFLVHKLGIVINAEILKSFYLNFSSPSGSNKDGSTNQDRNINEHDQSGGPDPDEDPDEDRDDKDEDPDDNKDPYCPSEDDIEQESRDSSKEFIDELSKDIVSFKDALSKNKNLSGADRVQGEFGDVLNKLKLNQIEKLNCMDNKSVQTALLEEIKLAKKQIKIEKIYLESSLSKDKDRQDKNKNESVERKDEIIHNEKDGFIENKYNESLSNNKYFNTSSESESDSDTEDSLEDGDKTPRASDYNSKNLPPSGESDHIKSLYDKLSDIFKNTTRTTDPEDLESTDNKNLAGDSVSAENNKSNSELEKKGTSGEFTDNSPKDSSSFWDDLD
jgi:hypothetical protein